MVKVGTVELSEAEAYRLYSEKKYIVTYSKIYRLRINPAVYDGVYYSQVYSSPYKHIHFTQRGRFLALTAEEVNKLLGFRLMWENEY